MIITIVPAPNAPDGTKRWFMCNGMFCHVIDTANLAHVRGLHTSGALVLWNGGAVWNGGWVPAFGVIIESLGGEISPAGLAEIKAAAAAGAASGASGPSLAQIQGGVRAELDATKLGH